MATYYGVTRTFGTTSYGNDGMLSMRSAILDVYQRAYEDGKWEPELLRERWWQIFRPKRHYSETQIFLDEFPHLSPSAPGKE